MAGAGLILARHPVQRRAVDFRLHDAGLVVVRIGAAGQQDIASWQQSGAGMGATPICHRCVARHGLPAGADIAQIYELGLLSAAKQDPRPVAISRHQGQQHRRKVKTEIGRVGKDSEVLG
jgi:hypothetical protein